MIQDGRRAGSPAGAFALAPGQLLAARYRIVRPLGRGAVGEVYEAEDLELGGRVAVKILRPEIAGSAHILQRFKREIQLARKVTHPNVCRVFDLVYHTPPEGAGLAFLTMELLEGETLAERLARKGPLPPAEVLAIVRQIAAALAAAHAAGVVHRDLKCGNVFLVEATGGRRAVVTDFGLAVSPLGGAAASLTATGELVGSPAYMAPEQVRGEEPTPATDVYALGVVLFEMVTGELPFAGKSAFYTALKRLQEPPPSPRGLVPDLDPAWDAAILRCLAREPGDRFASAEEVVAALAAAAPEGAPASGALPASSGAIPRLAEGGRAPAGQRSAARPVRWSLVAALLAAALVLVVGSLRWIGQMGAREVDGPALGPGSKNKVEVLIHVPNGAQRRSRRLPGERAARLAVAVLGFQNLSGRRDADYLGSSLAYMLPTDLGAGDRLRLLPVEEVARAQRDLGLVDRANLSADSLRRLRQRLGADLVVTGSYVVMAGGRTRFDAVVQDTRSGEALVSLAESGTEEAFLDTVTALGRSLRERLRAGALSPVESAAIQASRLTSAAGTRLYAEGLDALRLGEAAQARDLLVRAARAEPRNPLVHSALAAAWAEMGYDARAVAEAQRALALAAGLRGEERRAIEARAHEMRNAWQEAAQIYRELAEYFPDNPEYGLRLAAAQTAGGDVDAALGTLQRLRRLPRPLGEDPRIDLAEARAAAARSDYRGQQAAAERGAARAAALGARSLQAQAELERGIALHDLGEYAVAAAALATARDLTAAAGDPRGRAEATRRLGVVRYRQGRLREAKRLYTTALAAYRDLGSKRGEASLLSDLANLVSEKERDYTTARRLYAQALALHRETNNRRGMAGALLNLGNIFFWEGDLEQAQRRYEEAAAGLAEIGHRLGVAATTLNLGNVLLRRGDLEAAGERLREARRQLGEIGDKSYLSVTTLQGLGEVELLAGDLAAARRWYAQAAALEGEVSPENRAQGRCGEAALALAAGRPEQAEALARQALALLGGNASGTAPSLAHLALARALLAQGRAAAAEPEAKQAAEGAAAAGDAWLEVQGAITRARVAAARGDAAGARTRLVATLATARRRGFAGQALEARLALAELDLAAGDAPAARTALAALAAEAQREGFGLLARRAERALASRG